jgi:hypothetical protein
MRRGHPPTKRVWYKSGASDDEARREMERVRATRLGTAPDPSDGLPCRPPAWFDEPLGTGRRRASTGIPERLAGFSGSDAGHSIREFDPEPDLLTSTTDPE